MSAFVQGKDDIYIGENHMKVRLLHAVTFIYSETHDTHCYEAKSCNVGKNANGLLQISQ